MKLSIWFTSATFLFALVVACPAVKADQLSAPTIRPRLGLDLDTAGAGAEPFSQFEGFFPLWQNAGRDLGFFQGQLSFDTDANLGANLQLGYRRFVPGAQRTFGGYFAFDQRGTDTASFSQLGVGLETLGKGWDLRLNGYLPVGDRRELVDGSLVDAGLQFSDVRFVGNQLTATAQQQQGDIRRYEAALGGVDLEVGTRLLDIGDRGSLRGFGGLYYYGGPGVDGSLGWRLRLQAELTEYLRTGLALQNDDIFGTNVRFTIGAALPKYRATSAPAAESDNETNEVIARLGESIGRTGHIVVDSQTEIDLVASGDVQSGSVINPATGQPWFFNHVTPGASGDGTFEAPVGELSEAIATIPTDGNGIVYVGQSNGTVFPGSLTVPGGVQLLSTGPAQFIAASNEATQLQLPFSGSGDFPLIDGIVNLGSSPTAPTVLSGFNIQNNSLPLPDSLAPAALTSFDSGSGYGVFADNSLGEVIIRSNFITASNAGIYTSSEDSTEAGGVTISGNTVNSPDQGIRVTANNATLTGDITISGNTVTNGGIVVDSNDTTLTGDITISENAVEGGYIYGLGIGVGGSNSVIRGNVVIGSNTVDTPGIGIATGHDNSDLTGGLTIRNNTIGTETAAYGGIVAVNQGSKIGSGITISGNTVEAQSVGIGVVNYGDNEITGGITISGNPDIQVSGGGGSPFGNVASGIAVANSGGTTLTDGVNISNNGSIQVTADNSTPATGIVVFNNQSQIAGGVTINSNESIKVTGANTNRSGPGLPSPSDIGTVGIAVVNSSMGATPSTISGGVTISGNTEVNSSEYGIAAFNSASGGPSGTSDIDGITITGNRAVSVDDGLVVVNIDKISGSVTLSDNMLTSVEDDGIDFSNLVPSFSQVVGDVTFANNTFIGIPNANGRQEIKCTNNGSIGGSAPSPCPMRFP